MEKLDKLLVATMADRKRHSQLFDMVDLDSLGTQTAWILKAYRSFFEKNPAAQRVDHVVLETMIRHKMGSADSTVAMAILDAAKKVNVTQEQVAYCSTILLEQQLAGKIAKLINDFNDGADVDISEELYRAAMATRVQLGSAANSMFEEPNIHEIIDEQTSDAGFVFPQLCLQEHIRGITPPKSIGIAAPVDSGKTSFLANIITSLAPQAARLYPGRPILWFSNEGVVREVWPRLYSSALKKDALKLRKIPADKLYDDYAKAVGGDRSIIKMKDAHGWSLAQIDGVIEEMDPVIVVYDMLANFKVPGASGSARHEQIELAAQYVRESAALHNHLAISTFQLSVDGYNDLYPAITHIKDSKIGLQGALDLLIMMGKLDAPEYDTIRGLSTPKNKLKRVGKPSNFKKEVIFYPDIAVFSDT